MPSFIKSLFFALVLLMSTIVRAQLVVPEIFSDNMVLQRDKPVPVWGRATPGQAVSVSFGGGSQTAKADAAGQWKIMLPSMPANAVPQSMTVQGESTIVFKNILVGDVWLCSGQSNMEYPLDRSLLRYAGPAKGPDVATLEITAAKPEGVRYILVDRALNQFPKLPTKGWVTGEDGTVKHGSAIGYFFAKEINSKMGVPIGVITSAWGGTRIEPWVPESEWLTSPVFRDSVKGADFTIDRSKTGTMFKGMISPMVPFAIKGVLWYQGESNVLRHDHQTYPEKFRLLVASWRRLFNDADMPFYYVQLAPYSYSARKDTRNNEDLLPYMWEAQTSSLTLKNTGMVVTTDLVDNLADIHPSYKWEIAHRLALVALNGVYQQKGMVYSGPSFVSAKRKKKALMLSFDHVGGGLALSDGKPLTWFSIAGKDLQFAPAAAVIEGNQLKVLAPTVKKPMYVRFAWSEKAQPNFINKEGLPALPFRTDASPYKE
jgi:sialate O-acetylesterase